MRMTSFEEFSELASHGTFVPVCKELMADLLTPVSAYLKIAEQSDHAFLLESVAGGEHVGRYSFLGKDPFLVLRSRGGRTIIDRSGERSESTAPFLERLRGVMATYSAPQVAGLPRFTGGAVGYLGYDAAAWFETGRLQPGAQEGDEAEFMLCDTILAFDHVRHRILILANAQIDRGADLASLYQLAWYQDCVLGARAGTQYFDTVAHSDEPLTLSSNVSREEFERMVVTAKEHITAGDIYQVVLSQRFETPLSADAFAVYRALRHVNPSPYMYFLRMGKRAIVGASPEMLVRVEGDHVQTHPIAGTRPRGSTAEGDVRLGEELSADEKERAEHVMLVDLGRNDIGRVSTYGSVTVPRYMAIERYSHVMHLVSVVEDGWHQRLTVLMRWWLAFPQARSPERRRSELWKSLLTSKIGDVASMRARSDI